MYSEALAKILRLCNMRSFRDGAHGITLQELTTQYSKPRYYGDTSKLAEVKDSPTYSPKEGDRRFLVRFFISPASANSQRFTLWSKNAVEALECAAKARGQSDREKLGPYIVEEHMPDGSKAVRLSRNAEAFLHDGPIDTKLLEREPAPSNVVELKSYTRRPAAPVQVQDNTTQRDKRIGEVLDAFAKETQPKVKKYTVHKD